MTKSPKRPVIAAARVAEPVHAAVKESAAASGRSMSAELAALAEQAIAHSKRFPDSAIARATEAAILAFLVAGESYARDIAQLTEGQSWSTDYESRRAAFLAACQSLLSFVTADPRQQKDTLEMMMGRVAFQHLNFPRPGQKRARP